MTTCVEAGVHYLTRLSRYEILESAPVTEHLSSASWTEVEDALSGPKRQATELGLLTLSAGRRVVRDNAKPAPAVHSAAVVAGNRSGANTPWRPIPADDPAGGLAVAWPVLLPSVLRHTFRETCGEILAEVKLRNVRPVRRVIPRYFATGAAERQQRRRSWTWRCQRNELPAAAEVHITLHGGRAAAKLLESTEKALAAA